MLIIGKHKINAFSTLPDRATLTGDDALIFDALFTGGVLDIGLSGSYESHRILRKLITNSRVTVIIKFGELSEVERGSAQAYTDPNGLDSEVLDSRQPHTAKIKGEILIKLSPTLRHVDALGSDRFRESGMAQLRMALNHELSHAYNMATDPDVIADLRSRDAITRVDAYYDLEIIAFMLDAELALGLDDIDVIRRRKKGWANHADHSDFTYEQLLQKAGENISSPVPFVDRLKELVDYALKHLGGDYEEWKKWQKSRQSRGGSQPSPVPVQPVSPPSP